MERHSGLTNGTFELVVTSGIGSSSSIEVSDDLATWTFLATVTNTTRTVHVPDPDAAGHKSRFYRASSK